MNDIYLWLAQGVASIAVCWMGSYCMKITKGETGIGWAILGIAIIWGK